MGAETMNGFLVLLCHTMDDLPVGLFKSFQLALAHARAQEAFPDAILREVYCTDCSTPVCMKIVQFVGGKPIKCDVVMDFHEIPIFSKQEA